MKIAFFVEGKVPNGDLFYTREYVKHIIKLLPDFNFEYYHGNNLKTLLDLNINQPGPLSEEIVFNKNIKFIKNNKTFFINTWNGLYSPKRNPDTAFYFRGTNFEQLTTTWDYIFSQINLCFGTSIKVEDKSFYIPSLDYSKYNIANIDSFIKSNKSKKVLISNGPVTSKQSFQSDMKNIIEILAIKHPTLSFICTHSFDTLNNNIFFTDNIVNINDWDMAEISYLSRSCDIIIGKNSGPFVWCMTKENLFDSSKSIISLNTREHDSLAFGLEIFADYTWSNNFDEAHIFELINEKITHNSSGRWPR